MLSSWLRYPLVLLLVCVCAGCSQAQHEAAPALADYLQRLSRVLEVDVPEAETPLLIAQPAPREILVELAQPKIDMLEFLRMTDCHLQRLVAHHNSSLGKFARPSQRLVYELEFLQHGAACEASLLAGGRGELARKLAAVIQQKRRQLPKVIWQATLGAGELRAFWKAPTMLDDYPAATGAEVPNAMAQLLRRVERWLGGDWEIDATGFERELQLLRAGDGGALWQAWQLLAGELDRGSALLSRRQAERPLCYNGKSNRRADILLNVVRQKFIAELQPWAVALNRRRYELLPAVRALEKLLAAAEPGNYRTWREQRDRQFKQAFSAPRRHVAALQPLLEQCGLAPGSRP